MGENTARALASSPWTILVAFVVVDCAKHALTRRFDLEPLLALQRAIAKGVAVARATRVARRRDVRTTGGKITRATRGARGEADAGDARGAAMRARGERDEGGLRTGVRGRERARGDVRAAERVRVADGEVAVVRAGRGRARGRVRGGGWRGRW